MENKEQIINDIKKADLIHFIVLNGCLTYIVDKKHKGINKIINNKSSLGYDKCKELWEQKNVYENINEGTEEDINNCVTENSNETNGIEEKNNSLKLGHFLYAVCENLEIEEDMYKKWLDNFDKIEIYEVQNEYE